MTQEFDAEIREGRGGGAWVGVPFDVVEMVVTPRR